VVAHVGRDMFLGVTHSPPPPFQGMGPQRSQFLGPRLILAAFDTERPSSAYEEGRIGRLTTTPSLGWVTVLPNFWNPLTNANTDLERSNSAW